jgi:hypothetical protein
MQSELRQKLQALRPRLDDHLGDRIGINPETDLDHVVAAVLDGSANRRALVVARGRFDEGRIEALVREKGGRVEEYRGKRLLLLGDAPDSAVVFPERDLALFGEVRDVRTALETAAGATNVTDNGSMMALIREVADSTLWAVGAVNALKDDPRVSPNLAQQLPPLDTFAFSGQIDGGLRARLRADARDAAAAQNLRDMLQGLLALGRIQAGTNPVLGTVLNSVQLAGDGRTVAMTVTIPSAAFDLLAPRGGPRQQARVTR